MEFIVRTWYTDVSRAFDQKIVLGFGAAMDRALEIAHEPDVRSTAVIDQNGMVWAQFNMLWAIPVEAS